MSVRAFAAHLGVAAASVTNWERRGERIRLRDETQQILDTDLRRASAEVRARFEAALLAQRAPSALASSQDGAHRLDHGECVLSPGPGRSGVARHEPAAMSADFDDAVPRRDMLRLGTAATVGLFGGSAITAGPLSGVARALTAYGFSGDSDVPPSDPPPVHELSTVVSRLKRAYQACHYQSAMNALPRVLDTVRVACGGAATDELYALAADAYQVAASVLLKFDDAGLAAVAADRGMDMATRSESPVVVAASARAVTHALMAAGHPARAAEVSTLAAAQLDQQTSRPDDSLSVYGALVLRGAIAAARAEDRPGALRLLDEADDTAQRLGRDGNAHWTAFGPTNVLLHRVNVALVLGDAGTALDYAGRVQLDRVPVAERKASLFVDAAHALTQRGRYERAFEAIRTADGIAPEEVRSRRAVRTLLGDVAARSPQLVGPRVREFISKIDEPG